MVWMPCGLKFAGYSRILSETFFIFSENVGYTKELEKCPTMPTPEAIKQPQLAV